MRFLLLAYSPLILLWHASPALAADPIAVYELSGVFHTDHAPDNYVRVEVAQDVFNAPWPGFNIDALPVGQISRQTGLDFSGLGDTGDTRLNFYLFWLGHSDDGYYGASSTIPITSAEMRSATTAELEFARWEPIWFYSDEGVVLETRIDIAFELRLYSTPEPSSAALLFVALAGSLLHRSRHSVVV